MHISKARNKLGKYHLKIDFKNYFLYFQGIIQSNEYSELIDLLRGLVSYIINYCIVELMWKSFNI